MNHLLTLTVNFWILGVFCSQEKFVDSFHIWHIPLLIKLEKKNLCINLYVWSMYWIEKLNSIFSYISTPVVKFNSNPQKTRLFLASCINNSSYRSMNVCVWLRLKSASACATHSHTITESVGYMKGKMKPQWSCVHVRGGTAQREVSVI